MHLGIDKLKNGIAAGVLKMSEGRLIANRGTGRNFTNIGFLWDDSNFYLSTPVYRLFVIHISSY